ncbi:MAG: oligoendopeptidase F family protein [Bacilli bacterium]|nr:oligoendopeptidase F family protein [Bacilli bacterium]
MKNYKNRSSVEEKYKWDLTEYIDGEESFQKTFQKTLQNIEKLGSYVGCTKNPKQLYDFLQLQTEVIADWEDLYVYAYLVNDQELGIPESIERKNQTEILNLELVNHIHFFAPELLKLSKKDYEALFDKNPKLLEYKAMLDQTYREKGHVLSEKEEMIISSLCNSMNHFSDMSSMLVNNLHHYGDVTVEGEDVEIAANNYRYLMHNREKEIRHQVRDQFQTKLGEYSPLNAMFLSSFVSMQDAIANIRHFDSSWDKKLFQWNIPSKVFETLTSTVENHLDSLHRYYDLKRKVLGLKKLTSYDIALELSKSDKEYSIEDAQSMILKAVSPLGEEYQKKFQKIIDDRYIDYCQYKGKCGGGYSFSTMRNNSRILMSYNGGLESVSTIAHEGGHNVHHQFVKENNPLQYRDVPSIVAEVASLTNECLLSSYLAKNGKTKEEKLAGISNILDVVVSNLFGAVREGKLEEEMYSYVHEGNMLTKEYLDTISMESFEKYYGDSVVCDDLLKNSWVTRSHYYMNFYLYSYAICISVACSIASKILKGDSDTLHHYLDFLKVGSDKWPMEVYSILGVNLEDEHVYCDAIAYFDSLVEEFEKIVNE